MAADDDFQASVQALGNLSRTWDPFAIIQTAGFDGRPIFSAILPRIITIGCGLLALMLVLRLLEAFSRQLENSDEDTGLLGIVAEATLLAVLILAYDPLVLLFPHLFTTIGESIARLYSADLTAQVAGSLQVLGNEKVTDFKFWTAPISMSVTGLLAAMLSYAALVLIWVLGKLQGYLFTFWYLMGPLALPTLLFPPLRRIGAAWFSSLMGTAFMGIIGSIYFLILVRTSWLPKAFAAGSAADFMTCMVYSLICILSLVSIPLISMKLWSGLESNIYGAAAGAKSAMQKGTGVMAAANQRLQGLSRAAAARLSPQKPPPPTGP